MIFIGLAALTVPHMMLVDGMFGGVMERMLCDAQGKPAAARRDSHLDLALDHRKSSGENGLTGYHR